MSSIYDQRRGLSNIDLKNYFEKHNIPFNEVNGLSNLNPTRTKQSIVYTGSEPDPINNGVTKHWLHYTPINNTRRELFDSYGDESAYNDQFFKNNNIRFVNRHQLQAFDTNVCGEYCAAWAKFIHEHPERATASPEHLLEEFIQKHGFTKNRVENDKKIQKYYQETK